MSRVLAVDLGGTNLRAGLADTGKPQRLRPIGRWPAPTRCEIFKQTIADLIAAHSVSRVGLAVPGLARGTVCAWIPNLPFLDGVDIAALFPETVVAVGNDAQFALLGEATAGAAAGLTDAILLAIGTGIGSAVLSSSRIARGAQGAAASFGWACADACDPGDDRAGWLERHASGSALDRLAQEAGLPDGAALIDRARAGDAAAMQRLDAPVQALGVSLAGAVALLDPQAIVITGGVASALDVLRTGILAAMRRHLPPHLRGIRVVAGTCGSGASLVGAAIAAGNPECWEHVR